MDSISCLSEADKSKIVHCLRDECSMHIASPFNCIGKRVKWSVLTEFFKRLFVIFRNKSKSRSIHMKMSLLKSIYIEILLIETQTEITTFKTVMVKKKNKKKYFFGTTYSGVVVVFCNRLKRLNSKYKQNSKQ